ncbi:MAG TPA: SDR family NAD(P)-dependent oxidoreductase, partial [Thermoanaerobaculia bacterium]|nr:SDR family NAD(P)-dependent oxidoreductase [Thermoanaerobaculia bacterium]
MARALEGTVALVTGASSGIGEATGRALAGLGAAVALVARRKERLDRLAAEITSKGGRA